MVWFEEIMINRDLLFDRMEFRIPGRGDYVRFGKHFFGAYCWASYAKNDAGDVVVVKMSSAKDPEEQDGADYFFGNEIRILRRAPKHKHLVRLLGTGYFCGEQFMALEPLLVDSDDLNGTVDRAVRVATSVGEAVHSLHNFGFCHRDIGLKNIRGRLDSLNMEEPVSVLMDFGFAALLDRGKTVFADEKEYTYGTPSYLPPELFNRDYDCKGLKTYVKSIRRDVYSLGATLYELLTHNVPYTVNFKNELLYCDPIELHLREQNPDVSPQLEKIVQRSLSTVDRRPMMDEFLAELKACV